MKSKISTALIILILFLVFLWLEKPFRELLVVYHLEPSLAKNIAGITVRMVLIGASISLIKKFKLLDFTGLSTVKRVKNLQAVLIPSVFIIFALSNNWDVYTGTKFPTLLLFACFTIMVGMVEELVFRGVIFPLFIKDLVNYKKAILLAAILSSLFFGMVHFVNLFQQPENIVGIISQVFFATSIGVFFCGLMVRTENILIPVVIHALVNFGFGVGELDSEASDIMNTSREVGWDWNSILPTAIFFTFIFLGGVFMIVKSDKAHLYKKLAIVDDITTS